MDEINSLPILSGSELEFIPNTEISPFLSKGVCKVCYVGQEPNRNGTIITKEVALEMGKKLPGCPVVGYYDEESKDFEEHSRDLDIKEDGTFSLVDITKPYGFVPTDSKVWFQMFEDPTGPHEYLCCEVYIWSGIYPESKRVTSIGNNQSMELDPETAQGHWETYDNHRVFIFSEALIQKLCILGEEHEPCFEGASFATNFSLQYQEVIKKLEEQIKTIQEGGTLMEEELYKKQEEEKPEEQKSEGGSNSDDGKKSETPPTPPQKEDSEGKESESSNKEEDEDKKKKYSLEEIPEYMELVHKFAELEANYNALAEEAKSLREFKLAAERKQKQEMIDGFYMLSDSDKKDIIDHIDSYSLDEIEAKLSVCYARSTMKKEETTAAEEKLDGLFSLGGAPQDNAPDWIKAVRKLSENN